MATASSAATARRIVGQTVQLNGVVLRRCVGFLAAKGSTGPQDQDDRVIAPLTAVQDTLTGYGTLSSISVKAASADAVNAATAEVTDILDGPAPASPRPTRTSRSSIRARSCPR